MVTSWWNPEGPSTVTVASPMLPFATTTAGSNSTYTGLAVTVGQNSQPTYVRAFAASAQVFGMMISPVPPGGAPSVSMGGRPPVVVVIGLMFPDPPAPAGSRGFVASPQPTRHE